MKATRKKRWNVPKLIKLNVVETAGGSAKKHYERRCGTNANGAIRCAS